MAFQGALQHPAIGFGAWQPVCLLALAQLQAVLEMPQELVGAGQIMKFLAADVPLVVQFVQ